DAHAGPDKSLNCAVTSITLSGSSSSTGVNYHWAALNGGHIVSGINSLSPVVDSAGTYTLTVTFISSGCSTSDVTLVDLIIHNISSEAFVHICNGDSYTPPGGTAQSTSGTYITHILNAESCDSMITTHLDVIQNSTGANPVSICEGSSYTPPGGTAMTS